MLCRLHTAIMESYTNAVMPLQYSIPLVPTSSVKFYIYVCMYSGITGFFLFFVFYATYVKINEKQFGN